MATRNKRKLAASNKKNCEEHPRSNVAQNSNVFRSQEDYITKVSEEIEGRVTKKLSQEFSRTENRILGALARLDDFLMNPLLQGHSGTTPETSRNVLSINQRTNEDDSQSNPHPEAGLLNSGREDRHDMAMGVLRECEVSRDIRFSSGPYLQALYNMRKKIFHKINSRTQFSVASKAFLSIFLPIFFRMRNLNFPVISTHI